MEHRRSERRSQVPSVGAGARGVVFRTPRVSWDVRCVSHGVLAVASGGPTVAPEGEYVSAEAGVVIARSRWVAREGTALLP